MSGPVGAGQGLCVPLDGLQPVESDIKLPVVEVLHRVLQGDVCDDLGDQPERRVLRLVAVDA